MEHVLEIRHLSKTFGPTRALDDINLAIDKGQMVALLGPSGSGKSTLLRHLSGLVVGDRRALCCVTVMGRDIQKDGSLCPGVRGLRARVGFIFQQFNLVERLSVLTNVLAGRLGRMPLWRSLPRWFTAEERQEALKALERVGIAEHALKRAGNLSGGQQQRAAIARALVQKAEIILADEPIASLDPHASHLVMQNLSQINQEDGVTVLVSLHQVDFALAYCTRVVALKDGRVHYDGAAASCSQAKLREIYGSAFEEIAAIDPGGKATDAQTNGRRSPSIRALAVNE
ncbi:MAG: phosphonate ABC transporter ATP-binding protein [Desulfobacterales bacterium]|jgi:phosphonate transport system ATP-binding protein